MNGVVHPAKSPWLIPYHLSPTPSRLWGSKKETPGERLIRGGEEVLSEATRGLLEKFFLRSGKQTEINGIEIWKLIR